MKPGPRSDDVDARLSALEERVRVLEASRAPKGPRDADDLDVIRALMEALDTPNAFGLSRVRFTAAAVVDHAQRVDPYLRAALERADCADPRTLGKLFGRCESAVIDGRVLVRVGLTNEGWAWKFLQA